MYKDVIDKIDQFLSTVFIQGKQKWELAYNDQHTLYQTLKDELTDFTRSPSSYYGPLISDWVQGDADKAQAIEEDRCWSLNVHTDDDPGSSEYAARTLYGLLSGLAGWAPFTPEEIELTHRLEDKLIGLLAGEWTDLRMTKRNPENLAEGEGPIQFVWYPRTQIGSHNTNGDSLYAALYAAFH